MANLEPWQIIADDGVVQSAHVHGWFEQGLQPHSCRTLRNGAWHAHHEGGISDGRASILALPNCCEVPISVPSDPRNGLQVRLKTVFWILSNGFHSDRALLRAQYLRRHDNLRRRDNLLL